ncbi:unnamed protein product [Ceratitis capitata]|uniref:(Mediterranean fruit fly) hypothetical protein n=1 Tax=Ceratitis capitata TaxID=7213 RepID=A0A811V1Z5_CERCA|nr:unnamed protein product [Ceratitis capitata]
MQTGSSGCQFSWLTIFLLVAMVLLCDRQQNFIVLATAVGGPGGAADGGGRTMKALTLAYPHGQPTPINAPACCRVAPTALTLAPIPTLTATAASTAAAASAAASATIIISIITSSSSISTRRVTANASKVSDDVSAFVACNSTNSRQSIDNGSYVKWKILILMPFTFLRSVQQNNNSN